MNDQEIDAQLQALYLKLLTLHERITAANQQAACASVIEAIGMVSHLIDQRRAPRPE